MCPPSEAAAWDEIYQSGEYRQHWEYAHPSPELCAIVAAGIAPVGATALDLGCGAGREAIFLARCGLQVIGVDISDEALRIARERARRIRVKVDWRQGSVFGLPVADASVDFINDRGLLHLIPERRRSALARELRRVLRPGGVLLIRGSSKSRGTFVPISAKSIDRHFPPSDFTRGPVLPIQMHSDAGAMDGIIAVLRRR